MTRAADTAAGAPPEPAAAPGSFERLLSLWVALCIAGGVALGALFFEGAVADRTRRHFPV